MAGRYRIGIDIGGTFTDFTLTDRVSGRIIVDKVLTDADNPEEGAFRGLDKLALQVSRLLPEASEIIHATTLVTNAIIEGKGAKTALITTEGFRDILEIAREVRYDVFDMFIGFPPPLVPRPLRIGIRERVLADGTVEEPVDEAGLMLAARQLADAGVETIAICFLHAYRNPENECRAAAVLREVMPAITLSLSHEVHPEPKEYERTSTTVTDAYVKLLASRYLERLEDGLRERGFSDRLLVMLSHGGAATAAAAKAQPVQMLESGPVAGVEAAAFFGGLLGVNSLLAFDMGGTTAKLCVVENGRAARTRAFEVARVHRFKPGSGYPVSVPVYDLLEIGAGGGSIARINSLGLLQVGPDSTGARPGPACYGLGGVEPTVTDADVLLGYVDPEYFLGGEMRLDRIAAERAIAVRLAEPVDLRPIEAAIGVFDLVNETMAAAARIYLADKGKSGADLTLVASGGAGPVHALELARKLGLRRVVVPPFPGVLSSLGLLAAPIAVERRRTVGQLLGKVDPEAVEASFSTLEAEAAGVLPNPAEARLFRSVELRHAGQDYPLEIPIASGRVACASLQEWESMFLRDYEALYGKVEDDNPVELAGLQVRAVQPVPAPQMEGRRRRGDPNLKGLREAYVANSGRLESVPVFDRGTLGIGHELIGPAVIEERESTTVLGRGDRLAVTDYGCFVIEVAIEAMARCAEQEPA